MWQPFVYPDRPEIELTELTALLCAGVLGLAAAAHHLGIDLPRTLLDVAVEPSTPAEFIAEAGSVTFAVVDSRRCLGMRWNLEHVRAVAVMTATGYLFVLGDREVAVTVLDAVDIADPMR